MPLLTSTQSSSLSTQVANANNNSINTPSPRLVHPAAGKDVLSTGTNILKARDIDPNAEPVIPNDAQSKDIVTDGETEPIVYGFTFDQPQPSAPKKTGSGWSPKKILAALATAATLVGLGFAGGRATVRKSNDAPSTSIANLHGPAGGSAISLDTYSSGAGSAYSAPVGPHAWSPDLAEHGCVKCQRVGDMLLDAQEFGREEERREAGEIAEFRHRFTTEAF